MFLVFALSLAVAMVLIHTALVLGAVRSLMAESSPDDFDFERESGRISVVIPARNEEPLLPRLLGSLERQDTDRFEIVLVNDRSEDATAQIMAEFAERHGRRVRIVQLTDSPGAMNPKQRALAAGVAVATGDLLLMTDADCLLPAAWVRTLGGQFRDPNVGLVVGAVMPRPRSSQRAPRWFDLYQSFDQLLRFQYCAGAAGLGIAAGGFGNNLAVRRAALDNAGGFEGLRYTLTEDAQLIAQVRETGCWQIRAVRRRGVRIAPATELNIRALCAQSLRWNSGGLFSPDLRTRLAYRLIMVYLMLSVFVLPLGLLIRPVVLPALASFISMLMLSITAGLLNAPGAWYWITLVPNLLLSMVFYSFVIMVSLFRPAVPWKGARLSVKSPSNSRLRGP
ncbi:MAG: glycosyltransferase [Spirochaetaceae bacterium]|nr:MAG: glycosyltransferase [Spirochaetaceae bacterium]